MKKLRFGIFGYGRGEDNVNSILLNDGEVVAVCDADPAKRKAAADKIPGVALYDNFDEFIEHPMDAVYLCNYFNEHAPYAIRALEKNIHVLSECTAAGTMAEAVALVRAAEKSKAIYMLAENYPYMLFNREMQKVYRGGTLGRVMFAEGEYNHPVSPTDGNFLRRYYNGLTHWRLYLPATYYITHSLGPLMVATHSTPVRVCALPVAFRDEKRSLAPKMTVDSAAIITTYNDDHSVFRVTGCAGFGAHENSYRLACEKGQIENRRGSEQILLRYNGWDVPDGMQPDNCYQPEEENEVARSTGHGGSDYYMFRDFITCVTNGKRPYLDEYVATTMSSVAILGHRSLLQFGVPYDIPDFHREADRVQYENDTATPFRGPNGEEPTIACSSDPAYRASDEKRKWFLEELGKKV